MKVLVGALLFLGGSALAEPCDCTHKRPIAVEFASADAVFIGTYEVPMVAEPNSRYPHGKRMLVFAVEAGYKNVERRTVHLMNRSNSTCAVRFEQGQTYLIYAFKTTQGDLHTHVCSRTEQIDKVIEEAETLGEPAYIREENR